MELEQAGDNLWPAEGPIVDFYSFLYPTRMVIMAHGGWQREDGHAFLKRAFTWLGR